ncbi:MAG: radical SAM protein [Candidatus Methanoperedens sp.]|nr:radical SAM protein [Candidatus Methanoperedens sp.]
MDEKYNLSEGVKIKVLLVFPPITVFDPDPTKVSPIPPLGLAYIAGYLESKGYNVEILDCIAEGARDIVRDSGKTRYGLSDEAIIGHISSRKPDIVGISSMFTPYATDVHNTAKIIKKHNPNICVVVGGAHCSIKPEWVLKDKNIDIAVIGEGELTFLELVERFEKKEDMTSIKGTAVRVGDKIIRNDSRPYIDNLDEIPFPARHLLPMKIYLENSKESKYIMRHPLTTLISSRGCPYNCVYCSIHSVWGNKWRGSSARKVVDEIEFLVNNYGIREIHFLDDNIGASAKRLNEICDEIIERKIDVKWATPNGIAHWRLNEELLNKMKRAGCYRLTFGIESGNIKTREFIGKTFPLDQAKQIIKHANRIGLWTLCTFIIGFPYEEENSIKDTINFAVESDSDFVIFFLLGPFPGTKVYEIFKKEGLLDFDWIFGEAATAATEEQYAQLGQALASRGTDTKHFTRSELQGYLSSAYAAFMRQRLKSFLNPLRVARKIRSFEDLRYALRLASAMRKSVYEMAMDRFVTHFELREKRGN